MNKTKELKQIIAKTFTPTYDELEDRIRLTINYQDIANRVDFMITRSFVINLVPSIDDYIMKFYGDNLVDEMMTQVQTPQSPVNNQNTDRAKDTNLSKTDKGDLNFLRTSGELLIKIDLSFHPKTKQTTLLFSSKETQVKATLDANSFQQIIKIIKKSIPNFKWGISPHF